MTPPARSAGSGEKDYKRRVVRVGVSPMNPKVKWAQLECGHDIYGTRKRTVGKLADCDKCHDAEKYKVVRP